MIYLSPIQRFPIAFPVSRLVSEHAQNAALHLPERRLPTPQPREVALGARTSATTKHNNNTSNNNKQQQQQQQRQQQQQQHNNSSRLAQQVLVGRRRLELLDHSHMELVAT